MIKNKLFQIGINLIPNKLNHFSLFNKFLFRTFFTYNRLSMYTSLKVLPKENLKVEFPQIKCENKIVQVQSKEMRSANAKRKLKLPDKKYKMKTKSAARKRFRIVGRLYDKDFRHWPNNKRHKMLNKNRNNLKRKKSERYVCKADMRRLKRLFPYFRRKKYRN